MDKLKKSLPKIRKIAAMALPFVVLVKAGIKDSSRHDGLSKMATKGSSTQTRILSFSKFFQFSNVWFKKGSPK